MSQHHRILISFISMLFVLSVPFGAKAAGNEDLCKSYPYSKELAYKGYKAKFTSPIKVCYEKDGEIYEVSSPSVRLEGKRSKKGWIEIALVNNESGCSKLRNYMFSLPAEFEPGVSFQNLYEETSMYIMRPEYKVACARLDIYVEEEDDL